MVNEKQTIEELQDFAKSEPEKALKMVKKIIKKYPYFIAARVLELDILKATNQKGYKNALRSCALQTTQRNILYEHLENLAERVENNQQKIMVTNDNNLHSFLKWLELIDDKTSDHIPSRFDWIDDFLVQKSKIKPKIKPRSPTLFTKKAFTAADVALFLLYQNPISKYEATPTPSQPKNNCKRLFDETSINIANVKNDKYAINLAFDLSCDI